MEIINNYLNHLQEGIIITNKTIGIDIDKFISGESNKLIIVGPAGSGKSTLGRKLAKKYKTKFFEGDSCWLPAKKKFPEPPIDDKEIDKMNDIYYNCLNTKLKSTQRMILEGIGFLELFNGTAEEKATILKYPTIVLGTSALKSTIRAYNRAKKMKDKEISPIISMIYYGFVNVFSLDELMKKFKKERIKVKGSNVQVFQI